MTRISQDMALSGSGNENSGSNRPIPHTLRPESPAGGEEAGLTDVEDLEEARSRSASLVPTTPTGAGGTLSLPRRGSADDGGVTDTELMSENEDDPTCSGEGTYQIPEVSTEEIENILNNYGNEGEVCIQDHSGDRVTVSRQTLSSLQATPKDDEEDALTDMEEMEGEGDDDDVSIDIIDTDAPDFCPTAYGCYFAVIPEALEAMAQGLKDEVRITEKDPSGERKLSLIEFLNEGPLTDVESLDGGSPRRLSVVQANRLPTPEFPVDPMTDEESLDNDHDNNKSRLGLDPPRSITPSDCGEDRLYENITDEDEGLLYDGEKKVSFKSASALKVEEIDQGALTDCEDMEDSDGNDDGGDEWKPVKASNSSELDHILRLNFDSAQTKICMRDQEPDIPYPETPTDDEEIHCKLIDSKALAPRLVIYNHKDQLAIESDDEAGGGGVTDTEDLPGMEGEDASEYKHIPSAEDQKIIQDILDANCSSVSVQETEILENGKPRSGSVVSIGKGGDDDDTETEDLEGGGSSSNQNKKKSAAATTPAIPKIIVPEGCGEGNPNGGGNLIRRRGKKKHAKRKRDSAQSQFDDEPRSDEKVVTPSAKSPAPSQATTTTTTTTAAPPISPTTFYDTVAPNIACVSPGPGAHDDLFRSASRSSSTTSGAKSPSVIMDTREDGKGSPIHAEIKLLVRTSENGRESVEIRSLKEVVVPLPATSTTKTPSPVPPSPRSVTPQSPKQIRQQQQQQHRPPPLSSPSGESSASTTSRFIEEESTSPDPDGIESPILTQKLVVRFQEGPHDLHHQHPDVSASPSRVVESVGTFTERHQFWKEKDDEERKKRESVGSIEEDYAQGFDNSAFEGVDKIDSRQSGGVSSSVSQQAQPSQQQQHQRTPSPYEIERSKEAIFLDTDEPEDQEVELKDLIQPQQQPPIPPRRQVPPPPPSAGTSSASPDRKVLFQSMSSQSDHSRSLSLDAEQQLKEQIGREIFESELAEKIETLEPESKSLIQEQYEIRDDSDKSETETTEKLQSMIQAGGSSFSFDSQQERLEDVRQVASNLVSEIESSVERKLEGQGHGQETSARPLYKPSEPSSVDITDEELMSVGDISSPEPQRSYKFEGSDRRESGADMPGSSVGGTETGTPDTHAVRSSSSGEFFTAAEDNTIRSSSDEPSRPKSWDSSALGQVSNNFPGSHSGASEYQTALGGGVASSSDSYLGSLSSDASASGTLVASQIDLGQDLLGDDDEESEHAHIRTQVSQEGSIGGGGGAGGPEPATRSIYCEIGGREGIPPEGAGLPVTLTSSTSGTTVCTQVETTYEAKVKGDPELADDQDGNIMIFESVDPLPAQQRPVRTHRRSESQSWGDSPLRYGIEERIEEEQLKDFVFQSSEEDDMQDLFEASDDMDDPIQRPITPEPQFSPDDNHPRRIFYSDSSFEQEGIMEMEEEEENDKQRMEFSMEYERVIGPQQRLEDIEEESSVKNSPKSVMSLEMSSSLPELEEKNGSGSNGEKAQRPGSRESSSSLKEFESLECDILKEESGGRRDEPALSEIEEGHESQVSEISEATEIYEQDSGEFEDDKMRSSQQYETAEDASQMTDIQDLDADPMMTFFSSTIMDTQTPDTTETSQMDDFRERSENIATTDADSSLEFRAPGNTKMTSSGDSLDDEKTGKNIMEVSRDSLDFEKDAKDIPEDMVASADSLTGSRRATQQQQQIEPDELLVSFSPSKGKMSDSLELQPGQDLPGQMTESADSLNDGKSGTTTTTEERSSSGATGGAAGGLMATSSDSLEGQAIDPTVSSNTSTAGDAAMWSSLGGGSASTLVSSQEDLTLENQ